MVGIGGLMWLGDRDTVMWVIWGMFYWCYKKCLCGGYEWSMSEVWVRYEHRWVMWRVVGLWWFEMGMVDVVDVGVDLGVYFVGDFCSGCWDVADYYVRVNRQFPKNVNKGYMYKYK